MDLVLVFLQGVHILFQHFESGVCVPLGMGQIEQSQKHTEKTFLSRTLEISANGWRNLEFIGCQMTKMSRAGLQTTNISAIAHLLCHEDHTVLLVFSGSSSQH